MLLAADLPSLHLDPGQGSALVAGRIDSVLRDSLRARPVDLFPVDSLSRLKERGEWVPGERSLAQVPRILAATHRQAMGWVRMDPLESRFTRSWLLWARRGWILRGEAFRASAGEGIVSRRISREIELPLGFVGSDGGEKYPPSSADQREALDLLSRLWASDAIPFLVGSATQKR